MPRKAQKRSGLVADWPRIATAILQTVGSFGYGAITKFYEKLGNPGTVKKYFTGEHPRVPSISNYDAWLTTFSNFAHERDRTKTAAEWRDHVLETGFDPAKKSTDDAPTVSAGTRRLDSDEIQKLRAEFRAVELAQRNPALFEFVEEESLESDPLYLGRRHEMMVKSLSIGSKTIDLPILCSVLTRASHIHLSDKLDGDNSLPISVSKRSGYVKNLETLDAARVDQSLHGRGYLFNNKTYVMKNIEDNGTECTIFGAVSDYYSWLATHHAMRFELLQNFQSSRAKRAFNIRENFRKQPIYDRRRHAAISVSALLVHKDTKNDRYKIMIRKRDENVAVYRGLVSVIPGGMFQPEVSIDKEWNIQHCVIKEYCEELFDAEYPDADDPYHIYFSDDAKWRPAKELYDALLSGRCKLLHSGVVLNLLELDVEVCCVLLFEDGSFFERHRRRFTPNWEYMSRKKMMNEGGAALTEFDLGDVEAQFLNDLTGFGDSTAVSIASQWAPPGLACFWLGVDAVNEHLSNPKRRPPIVDTYL